MKELIWICGIIPEDVNEEIKEICLKENEDLQLSERFFRFHLHVSMKRTFLCEHFDEMKDDMKKLLKDKGEIYCGHTHLMKNRDMLWLYMDEDERLKEVHSQIDEFLMEKYSVPIDTFDKNYFPHITIFHKGDPENLVKMYERLLIKLPGKPVTIRKYAIGSKIRGNEFFDI